MMQLTPAELVKTIRNKYSISVKDDIISESALQASSITGREKIPMEYETTIEVQIYDPRKVMSYFALGKEETTVRVERVLDTKPKNPPKTFFIQPQKTIEIIKEYTFEEWDRPLKEGTN